ncbi:alanine racemase [uncultured Ilumatobacter sp.]|mgnify:FL=1|uniref:alanine racemase n=1 Tax=uncultured Ilumatobacter sp. TaxID=879968 RepID=UPI00374F6C9D
MTVRLTIRTAIWRSQVARIANAVDGLVPVIKGNGYGFGRNWLASTAAEFCDTVAVGTIHELDGLPDELTPVVLTPTLTAPTSTHPILTVGTDEHLAALAGWDGRVLVKLASPMRRFGRDTTFIDRALASGLEVVGVSVHPQLAGTRAEHGAIITKLLPAIDPAIPVWTSHLDLDTYAQLPATHSYRLRLGTMLWHGDKQALHLTADVIDVNSVKAGDRAGYRMGTVGGNGHLVMIGAGTANGVTAIAQDEHGSLISPFHFKRTRLALHEAPHMHTSMAFASDGSPTPAIGDRVDLQRPMHMTAVDEYEWL